MVDCPRPVVRPQYCRVRSQVFPQGETRTQQSMFDQTDVNAIVARFDRTGYLPPAARQAVYDDVTPLQGDLTEMIGSSRSVSGRTRDFIDSWSPRAPKASDTPTSPPPVSPAE